MRKTIFILSMLFGLSSYSQDNVKSIALQYGITGKESNGFSLNYNFAHVKNNYEFGAYYYAFKDNSYIPIEFTSMGVNLGYLYNALHTKTNRFVFSVGAGLNAGVSKIKAPANVTLISKDGFEYGVYAVAQNDIYLSEKISFLIRIQQNYFMNSTTGKLNPFVGAGFKYNFN